MADIINIKNEMGEVQYPITKPECVIDENGKNVLQLIKENGGGSYDDSEIREDIANLSETKAEKSLVETIYNNFNNTLEQVGQGMQEALQGFSEELSEQDAKVTELSAEVSGLSEKIENLPSGESEVFEAEYGVTTYEEIVAAYNEGKIVRCNYDNRPHYLNAILTSGTYFVANYSAYSYQLICQSSDTWYNQRVNNSHELTTLANTNVQVTIAGKTAEVATPQYVENAIQQSGGGGASSDKQGVIRQTQTWKQAADKGYDYVMSNLVRGAIPQANIDLFTSAGAVFNEESGYFELNGLTDISYEEMSAIYNAGFKMVEGYWMNNIRTNIFKPCNVYNSGAAKLYGFTGMYANRNCKAESFKFTEQETYGVALKDDMYGTYEGCIYLKTFGKGVFFGQDSNISDQAFNSCYSLETIYIRNLKKNISFKYSARLSNASILYMIKQSAATSPIVITLHADAKARAEADAEIVAALSEKTNVTLGV